MKLFPVSYIINVSECTFIVLDRSKMDQSGDEVGNLSDTCRIYVGFNNYLPKIKSHRSIL